jgi:hypothetical protein
MGEFRGASLLLESIAAGSQPIPVRHAIRTTHNNLVHNLSVVLDAGAGSTTIASTTCPSSIATRNYEHNETTF